MGLSGPFFCFHENKEVVMKQLFPLITVFTIILAVSFLPSAKADGKSSITEFSKSEVWRKLLYLKDSKPNESYIISNSFFLSGKTTIDPLSELEATIEAFYQPSSDNNHAQCKFPARLQMIEKFINLSKYGVLPNVNCDQLDDWLIATKADSISMVFASGYMNNPASMYGHLLLKFNQDNSASLLDKSINYGALVPNNENPLLYVFRGLFGGYSAGYSDSEFYRHQHNYSDVELRDMWEYQLAFDTEAITLISKHLWEVLPQRFEYYFLDENCAFHFAKLIELLVDEPIVAPHSSWVLPSAVVNGLTAATYKGTPLLKKVDFIQSQETKLRRIFEQLTGKQNKAIADIIAKNFDYSNTSFHSLNTVDKTAVVEALLYYLKVTIQKSNNNSLLEAARKSLLLERMKLPIGRQIQQNYDYQKPGPEESLKPSRLSIGYVNASNDNHYNTLGFRATYFDDLSPSAGHNEFSNLEMLDITLISDSGDLSIYGIDIVDIKSLYLPPMPWKDALAEAWSIRAGYEQLYDSCIDCGIYFAEADKGYSFKFNDTNLFYALVGGKVFVGQQDNISVYVKSGVISKIANSFSAKLEYQRLETFDSSNIKKDKLTFDLNYTYSKDIELRLNVSKQLETMLGLNMNFYWGF